MHYTPKTLTTMKKLNLVISLALVFMLAACTGGGNNQSASDESNAEEMGSEEMTSEANMEETGEMTTHSVDLENSQVMWEGTMMGMYSHQGTVKLTEGQIEMMGDDIVGGTFVVDLTSITPTDENYQPDEGRTKEKLVGHLSSNDFFNVEEYPTAQFTISSYDAAANTITGDLTIRGNTHQETIENVSLDPNAGTATGTLTFDRTKYDVNFQHPAQEMVLSDDIELQIDLAMQAS